MNEGNGKELIRIHDVALQHDRALKAMNEDSFEMLLTAILELKMDPTTMRHWQRSSREHKEVLQCLDLIDLIELRAHDLENTLRDVVKKHPTYSIIP